jgi:phage terminase large subunit GpA-like protein
MVALLAPAIANFAPRPRVRTLDWARKNVQTDLGRPYDHSMYPHLGNPGGPLDANDCPQYSTIAAQFASRLGKTFFGQVGALKTADTDPCPMMFASSDQKLATEVTARTYRMIEKCPPLRGQLRPLHRRRQDCVELANCRQFVAWSRSVSTLADKAIRFGHANEIDKWEHVSTSTEADPLKLFTDRFKEFPIYKRVMESTPSIKGHSRIENLRLQGTNCHYAVPCPHCGEYQKLELANLRWEKTAAGKSDPELARATAHYECSHCQGVIRDEHRGAMMRAGVWVPEGCQVDKDWAQECAKDWRAFDRPMWRGWSESPWITGTPARNGIIASYQLSSLYAIPLTWGAIAAEFVTTKDKPADFQNFINQWLGETWEKIKRSATWEQIGERIKSTVPRGIVPSWASLLTVGIDRQEDRMPWVVEAWGPERRCHTVAYGEAETFDQLLTQVLLPTWNHEDGGEPLRIAFGLMDSGFKPQGVHEFCIRAQQHAIALWPCRGSPTAMDTEYRQATLGENTAMPGMVLFHIDTIRTQLWIENQLVSLKPEDSGGYSLHAGSLGEHQDFLEQLINDAMVDSLDKSNNIRQNWERVNTNVPNDFRDCRRYAYVGMLINTRNKPISERKAIVAPKRSAVVAPGIGGRSGGSWL